MRPNLPFVSAKHTLVTYNITLSLITKTNQGPRCFHFSATSLSNLLTTSSTIDSAILMISIAFFVSGSARGSNGSSGGDNSVAEEKINQFKVTKINAEVRCRETIPMRFSRSTTSSARLASARASWMSFHFSS
jgi:hypothetical protein